MKPKMIALLTDFGTSDPFVGIMKAVIAEISPQTRLIDITHQIPPGDVQRAAFVLWQTASEFPPGTVFLSVVDPGVGTRRKAVLLELGDQIFIGPDNGLFSYLLFKSKGSAWELSSRRFQRSSISSTFHGRDIFAPAAAHAVEGVRGEEFGAAVQDLVTLKEPILMQEEGSLKGEVLSVDRFGNLITSIGLLRREGKGLAFSSWITEDRLTMPVEDKIRIGINGRVVPLVETFGALSPGDLAGLVGSSGLLEIAANQASAKRILEAKTGDQVNLTWD